MFLYHRFSAKWEFLQASLCSLDGYNAALLAVDRKLMWASEKVELSENVSEIREMFALISEGMKIIKSMRIDHS